MGRISIKLPRPVIGRRIQAVIAPGDGRHVEVDWGLTEGHYYACRDGRSGEIVVLRATGDMDRSRPPRPILSLAPGERATVGTSDILILIDLGTEEP